MLSQLSTDGSILLDDCQEIYDMQSIFLGLEMKNKPSQDLYDAVDIFKNDQISETVNLLLLCEDASIEEISKICSISIGTLTVYGKFLFKVREMFASRIDYLNYQSKLEEDADTDHKLNYALKVKWAISMGKEFVCWRLNLIPVAYNTSDLYLSVMKEAFFYHKEKAMGNDSVPTAEYLKSSKAILDAIKASVPLSDGGDDGLFDIEAELGIIIESRPHPDKTIDELVAKGMDVITNH